MSRYRLPRWILVLVAALLAGVFVSSVRADLPEFPADDDTQRALRVNEGDLVFLGNPPAKAVHHHHNYIVIDHDSLRSGWVWIRQCHENLDVFERVEIVFDATRVMDLVVLSSAEIARAEVVGASVQLEDVRAGARLCLALRSRALWPEGDRLELRNGPFMRKFLDGYYPMHVTMDVRFPAELLRFTGVNPKPQTGLVVHDESGVVRLDAWFEGRLTTRVQFQAVTEP